MGNPLATALSDNIGWVDTHIHLLPGLDDGPSTMEESLAMAEAAIADGTTHVVATSHANYQFHFTPQRVEVLGGQMRERLGDRLHVATGCELHLTFENVQAAMENFRLYSLNAGRYLLCEFPEYFERTSLRCALERLRGVGAVPVLAHPERNPVFQQHPEALLEFRRLGCISQVTASSFTGRFGKRAQQFSADLLHREWIHIVATDGHSAQQRPPHFNGAAAFITKHKNAELAQALCSANPWAILRDANLSYSPELPAKKKSLWARLRS